MALQISVYLKRHQENCQKILVRYHRLEKVENKTELSQLSALCGHYAAI